MQGQMLTVKEVAKILVLGPRSVWRLNNSKKIPEPLTIGGSVRWCNSDIQLWIELRCPSRETFEKIKKGDTYHSL